jgi:hypothetical protein
MPRCRGPVSLGCIGCGRGGGAPVPEPRGCPTRRVEELLTNAVPTSTTSGSTVGCGDSPRCRSKPGGPTDMSFVGETYARTFGRRGIRIGRPVSSGRSFTCWSPSRGPGATEGRSAVHVELAGVAAASGAAFGDRRVGGHPAHVPIGGSVVPGPHRPHPAQVVQPDRHRPAPVSATHRTVLVVSGAVTAERGPCRGSSAARRSTRRRVARGPLPPWWRSDLRAGR